MERAKIFESRLFFPDLSQHINKETVWCRILRFTIMPCDLCSLLLIPTLYLWNNILKQFFKVSTCLLQKKFYTALQTIYSSIVILLPFSCALLRIFAPRRKLRPYKYLFQTQCGNGRARVRQSMRWLACGFGVGGARGCHTAPLLRRSRPSKMLYSL
jgi:hypothetical protein